MSKPITYRFFVNDKRVSTAVQWKSKTNKDYILQVFPNRNIFESETSWRSHWEKKVRPSIRVETSFSTNPEPERAERPPTPPSSADESRWTCPACGKGPGNDHRMCICRAFNYSVDAWEKACGIRK